MSTESHASALKSCKQLIAYLEFKTKEFKDFEARLANEYSPDAKLTEEQEGEFFEYFSNPRTALWGYDRSGNPMIEKQVDLKLVADWIRSVETYASEKIPNYDEM